MMNLKRDWAVAFTLSLTLLTLFLFFLKVLSLNLIFSVYFEQQPVQHFLYWLLYSPGELFACVFPIGLIIFLVRLLIFRSQKIKSDTWNALAYVFLAALLSFGWLVTLFVGSEGLFSGHISTVHTGNRTYQLGYFSMMHISGYILAECDSFGLICDIAHIAIGHEGSENYLENIRLIIDLKSYDEALILEIDGEPVYTAPRFSP